MRAVSTGGVRTLVVAVLGACGAGTLDGTPGRTTATVLRTTGGTTATVLQTTTGGAIVVAA